MHIGIRVSYLLSNIFFDLEKTNGEGEEKKLKLYQFYLLKLFQSNTRKNHSLYFSSPLFHLPKITTTKQSFNDKDKVSQQHKDDSINSGAYKS